MMKKGLIMLMLILLVQLKLNKFHSLSKGKHMVKQYKKYLIDMAKKGSNMKTSIMNNKIDINTKRKLRKKGAVIKAEENVDEEGNPLPLFSQEEIQEFEKIYEQRFYLRKLQGSGKNSRYTRRQLDSGDTYLKEVNFILNQYGMYYTELTDTNFNGLIDMIRFDELVDDETANNIMNARPSFQGAIDSIQMEQIQSKDGNLISLPCFQIRDPYYDNNIDKTYVWWQICEEFNAREGTPDLLGTRIQIFQRSIEVKIIHIIETRYQFKYKKETIVVNDNDVDQMDTDIFDGWSYARQEEWGGSCRVGSQSPIDLKDEEVLATTAGMQIMTKYKGDPKTKAIRGTNDYFLIGNFGYVLYQNGISSRSKGSAYYCAWRMEFKFGGEHQINGVGGGEQQMEILVYHEKSSQQFDMGTFHSNNDRRKDLPNCFDVTKDQIAQFEQQKDMALHSKLERDTLRTNTDLVTSFLITVDPSNASVPGVFWKGISQVNFRTEISEEDKQEGPKYFTSFNIEGESEQGQTGSKYLADLEGLVDDGLSQAFRHSFYAYEGSLSQPNCQNKVNRIVFSEIIQVNAEYFQALKGKVLDGFNQGNNRKVQNTKGDRTYRIFKHIDMSNRNCSVAEVLKSFQNPAFKKLTTTEKQDWKSLLEQVTTKISEYTNARDRYLTYSGEYIPSSDTLTTVDNRNTQFTHTATISTKFQNIQRVSQENAAKIFNVKTIKDAKVGRSMVLGGNSMNDVRVTLLGRSSRDYDQAANPTKDQTVDFDKNNGQVNFKIGSDLIKKQDNQYKVEKEYKNMINKVQALDKIEQEKKNNQLDSSGDRKLKKYKRMRKLRKLR